MDTRARILKAAAELFHRDGYEATPIAAILKKAGVLSGTLYYIFPSKEALLDAVLDQYVDWLWPVVMQPIFERVSDPLERIFAVLESYREMLKVLDCTRGCPIGNLALEVADSRPEIRRKIALNFENWCKAIRGCLDEAADRLPSDLDREKTSRFVLTVMEGGIMQARAYRNVRPYEESVEQLRDYFDRLMQSRRMETSKP